MAWAAGFLDVTGWLTLSHVYTSHMTGNTASFAIRIAGAEWSEALRYAVPIVTFIAGLLYGAFVVAAARRYGLHSSFAIALGTEIALLVAYIAISPRYSVGLMPAALGIQTVTVTRVTGLRVYTTYLTGSLSKFAEAAVRYAFWAYDRTRGRFSNRIGKVLRVTPRVPYMQHAVLTAALWAAFFAGGICGALSAPRYGAAGALGPMIVLLAATATDLIRPVAAADLPAEKDSAH